MVGRPPYVTFVGSPRPMHLVTPTAVDIARTLMHINVVCFLRRQIKNEEAALRQVIKSAQTFLE